MTLFKNIIYSSSAKVLSILSQIFTLWILSKLFSHEDLGIWFLLSYLIFFFSLCDFGLGGGSLQNKLTYLHSQKNTDEAQKKLFFSSFFLISFFYLICFILLLLFSSFFLPILFPNTSYESGSFKNIFLLFSLLVILRFPFSIYSAALFAIEKSFIKSKLDLVENLTAPLLLFILYLKKSSLYNAVFSYYLFSLSIVLCGFFILLNEKKWTFSFYPLNSLIETLKSNFKLSCLFWIQNLLSLFLFSSSPFLISSLFGLETAASYCLCFKFCSLFISIHFAFLTPLSSFYTRSFYQEKTILVQRFFSYSLLLSFIYLVVCLLVMLIFYEPITLLWTGLTESCNHYLLLWMFLYGLLNCLSILLNSLNLIKKQLIYLLTGCLILFFILAIFSKVLSVNTVVIASIISQLPLLFSNAKEIFHLYGKKIKNSQSFNH